MALQQQQPCRPVYSGYQDLSLKIRLLDRRVHAKFREWSPRLPGMRCTCMRPLTSGSIHTGRWFSVYAERWEYSLRGRVQLSGAISLPGHWSPITGGQKLQTYKMVCFIDCISLGHCYQKSSPGDSYLASVHLREGNWKLAKSKGWKYTKPEVRD